MKITGSVQEKNGRFYFVLNLYDANGKRKIKWISTGLTVRGNKRKAEAMLHEVLLRYDEIPRARLRTKRFRVVLVTTASIHLQVYFHGKFTICISQIGLETWNSCC